MEDFSADIPLPFRVTCDTKQSSIQGTVSFTPRVPSHSHVARMGVTREVSRSPRHDSGGWEAAPPGGHHRGHGTHHLTWRLPRGTAPPATTSAGRFRLYAVLAYGPGKLRRGPPRGSPKCRGRCGSYGRRTQGRIFRSGRLRVRPGWRVGAPQAACRVIVMSIRPATEDLRATTARDTDLPAGSQLHRRDLAARILRSLMQRSLPHRILIEVAIVGVYSSCKHLVSKKH